MNGHPDPSSKYELPIFSISKVANHWPASCITALSQMCTSVHIHAALQILMSQLWALSFQPVSVQVTQYGLCNPLVKVIHDNSVQGKMAYAWQFSWPTLFVTFCPPI